MEPFKQFQEWSVKIRPEIEEVGNLLNQKLSDEPEELISDLEEIEVWNSRIGALLAQANSWLDAYKLVANPSREGRTEADRKIVLDSEVSPIRLIRDTLEHLCDSIRQRLILGESILSYYKSVFVEHKKRDLEKIY